MTALSLTFSRWLLLCGVGAVAGADGSVGPHAMLARPLVAAVAGGAVIGDPAAGVLAGAVLELMTLPYPPMGATRTPDTGVAGVVGGAAFAAAGGGVASLAGAVLAGWGAGWAGEWSLRWLRRLNGRVVGPREELAGDPDLLQSRHRWATRLDVLRAGLVTAALLVPAAFVASAAGRAPDPVGWACLAGAVVAAGIGASAGSAARVLSTGRSRPALLLFAVVAGVSVAAFLLS